jgi:hypothetical protein
MAVTVYNGELIAGGFFSNAGGIPANHIAKWNGTNWSTLGNGSNSIVYSMTVHNNQLISDGSFITSGGSAAIGIGAWDGATWSALGSGIGGGLYPYLFGLVSHKGDLYAGGLFQSAGGIVSNGAAMWNGTSWSPLNGGFSSAGNVAGAYAVCIYNNNVVFGGIFSGAGGVSSANVIEWVVPQVPTNLTIQNITVSAFESFCYDAIQVITTAGSNTAFHVLDGANVTMIAGEKIVMLPGTTVDSGGYLNAYITTTGQYCNTLPIAMASKVIGSAETTPAIQLQQSVSVYPNPTKGLFSLNVKNNPQDQDITVEIFNSTGITIERHLLMHETRHDFSLEGQPKGIYFLRVLTGKNQGIVKIILD